MTGNQTRSTTPMENQSENLKKVYTLGAYTTLIALAGILLDVIIGNITGGDLTSLPTTAIARFLQFQQNCLLGLYNLDLLNIINQLILVPAVLVMFIIHKQSNYSGALLSLVFFLVGTAVFVTNNTALPMLELSRKYALANTDEQRNIMAAAGEAMLARGAHGSPGVFLGFFLPNMANLMMSYVMLKGGIFSKATGWLGIIGSAFMLIYIILVNFVPGVDKTATLFAMPGGLLLMAWMVLYTLKLFKLKAKIR